jgi:beta-galactosidase/beta-glucuronidase
LFPVADNVASYTNIDYPFPVEPGRVSYNANETGSYIRTFKVPADFKTHQLRLRFEGVDSAFHVWVNGKEVGYSQGSRNPSEFDITKLVDVDGENSLAVRVYQFCDGSYIEDQVCRQLLAEDAYCATLLTLLKGSMVVKWNLSRSQPLSLS